MKFLKTVAVGATAGIIASLLAGCAPDTTPKDLGPYLSQKATWGSCDEELFVPAGEQSQVFASARESSNLSCATVVVPAVYSGSAHSEEFALQLMRVGSANAPLGTIFINPGGPGGSGVEQVQNSEFPAALLEQYSFIGFDPRGVNFSTFVSGKEIKCDDEADLATYFEGEMSPSTDAEYEEAVDISNEFMEDCRDSNPLWWTLSTANVVQDLEILRQVVTGDAPLNFIGSSYGTTIAGMYVTEFPEHVGKIVLDSPTSVDTDPAQTALADAVANEAKFSIYLEAYAAHAGISVDEAMNKVLEFKQLADDDKLIGFAGITRNPEYEEAMVSSEALFLAGIGALNYLPEEKAIETFIQAMDDLEQYGWNGTFESVALWIDGYDPDSLEGLSLAQKEIMRSNEYEVMTIVNSMDFSLPPLSDEEEEKLPSEIEEASPLLTQLYEDSSGYEYDGDATYVGWYEFALEDGAIPDPPSTVITRSNISGKQLLIIGSLRESVTPFEFAQDTAKVLKSALISVDSSMHAPAAYYDNSCINDILIRYFVAGEVLSDTACPGE